MKKIVVIMISLVSLVLLYGCSSQTYTAETIVEMNGNPIEINQLQLQFQASEIRDEVKPSNPQGYYPHYKEQDGYHYHVLSGTLKNNSNKTINSNQFKIESAYENETYEGKLVFINEIESYFWDEISPGAKLDFYLFSIVKDGQENPNEYRFYYDTDGLLEEGQTHFDTMVQYTVPNNLESYENT